MSESSPSGPVKRLPSLLSGSPSGHTGEPKVLCDRCGNEIYRMLAVWRCRQCGFKTDCCGW